MSISNFAGHWKVFVCSLLIYILIYVRVPGHVAELMTMKGYLPSRKLYLSQMTGQHFLERCTKDFNAYFSGCMIILCNIMGTFCDLN